jgi:hypothetical protein
MRKLVMALFTRRTDVAVAAEVLQRHGMGVHDIGVLMSDEVCGREFAKGTAVARGGDAGGPTLGSVVAGLAGVGAIAVPGRGFVAAGPLLAALAGVGFGDAAGEADGAAGESSGRSGASTLSDVDVRQMARELAEGGILVGVSTPEELLEAARDVLTLSGGRQVMVR